jgi:plasmid maintenance system killer protein
VWKEIYKLLDVRIINPMSENKWVSSVYVVPKKGGTTVAKFESGALISIRIVVRWRMCIDYMKLNSAIRNDYFPLLFIDQMLERLAKYLFFCYLDYYSGFFQISIHLNDQDKIIFTCPYSTFAYRRMSFDLYNAPTTFQRSMMDILSDLIENAMEFFMDIFLCMALHLMNV